MRIYTPAGDLAFKTFTFPDGQPHFILETYEREFHEVTIEVAIKSPSDLFLVLLASDVLRANGYSDLRLDIRYLLGARMDRAISWAEPFTLSVVARLINGCGFSRVRVLDAHSEVATRLIRNSSNVLPTKIVESVYTTVGYDTVIVTPDKGAKPRVQALFKDWSYRYCNMEKIRAVVTGNLGGFAFSDNESTKNVDGAECLIVDDICDGGATFKGQAKLLRLAGAKKVSLFVTHGIFSKGLPLEGIDRIYTTDSYCEGPAYEFKNYAVVVPVNMKEL